MALMFITTLFLSMPSFPKVVIGNLSLIVFAIYFCFVVVEVGNSF